MTRQGLPTGQMCKLKEAKLNKELQIVKEAKRRLKRKILKNI